MSKITEIKWVQVGAPRGRPSTNSIRYFTRRNVGSIQTYFLISDSKAKELGFLLGDRVDVFVNPADKSELLIRRAAVDTKTGVKLSSRNTRSKQLSFSKCGLHNTVHGVKPAQILEEMPGIVVIKL